MSQREEKTVGLIGARGYVGSELLALIAAHPRLRLSYASSRSLAGEPIPGAAQDQKFETLRPDDVASRRVDVCILALPNGLAGDYVSALDETATLLVDVSADHRFDERWVYGLPEVYPVPAGATRIANPGCYATAMQLALAPLRGDLAGAPRCFGVSGYSGAGTRPSPKNDPETLKDNLLPYAPVGHLHEREVTRHLGTPVHFMPHVAAFFRGIAMTVDVGLREAQTRRALGERYARFYESARLVQLSDDVPTVAHNARRHHAVVGGWQVSDDGRRAVVYATLDNLLKGAATQAIQNINFALGFDALEGIADDIPVAEQTA